MKTASTGSKITRLNILLFPYSYGGPFGKGDYLGCYLDLDNLEIYYTKNGQDLGLAFSISRQQQNQTFFPAVVLKVL